MRCACAALARNDTVNTIAKQALIGLVKLQAVFAVLLFAPAWTLYFWEAWLYWVIFFATTFFLTWYFLKHDPGLVERRLKAGPSVETEKSQKIIQALASVLVCVLIVLSGLDHHFRWSTVPIPIVLLADVLVVMGFVIIFFVFKENSYAASAVKVEVNQHVVSTGLYRLVRHPMYAGALLMLLATPVALGSLWGMLVAVAFCGVIVARLLNEEKYLSTNLPGYDAYRQKVRYRLLPFVW